MKHPLAWHRECLENMEGSIERERELLDRELAALADRERRLDELRRRAEQYRRQVETAEAAGKDGFVRERYCGGWDSIGDADEPLLAYEFGSLLARAAESGEAPRGVVLFPHAERLPHFDLEIDQEPIPGGVLVRVRAVAPKVIGG